MSLRQWGLLGAATDIKILIDNAGVMLATPVLAENSEDVLRRGMEDNVFELTP
jgi:hypothetical protein